MRVSGGKQGFTLVEMMAAMGIAMVIGVGSLAIVTETKKGVKKASDLSEVTQVMGNVLSVLAEPRSCAQALRSVEIHPTLSAFSVESPSGPPPIVHASGFFHWPANPGYPVESIAAGSRAQHLVGMIAIPTTSPGSDRVILAQREVARALGVSTGFSNTSRVQLKSLVLERLDDIPNIEISGAPDAQICAFRARLNLTFSEITANDPSGNVRWGMDHTRHLALNIEAKCPGRDGRDPFLSTLEEIGTQQIVKCGAYLPNTEQACRDLGGEYHAGQPVPCRLDRLALAHRPIDADVPPALHPAPISANGGFEHEKPVTDFRPGLLLVRGNGIVNQTLSTTSLPAGIDPNFPSMAPIQASSIPSTAPQFTFTRAELETNHALKACSGNSNRYLEQTALGTMSFRGYNTNPDGSNGIYAQAASIITTTDGEWIGGSSPTRMNFFTARAGRKSWLRSTGDNEPGILDGLRRGDLNKSYTGLGSFAIPALSIRETQEIQGSAELSFGVSKKFYTEAYGDTDGAEPHHTRGAKLSVETRFPRVVPEVVPGETWLQIAANATSSRVSKFRVSGPTLDNINIEARGIELTRATHMYRTTTNPVADSTVYIQEDNGLRIHGPGADQATGVTSTARTSVLATSDHQGRARWMKPKMIQRTGVVLSQWRKLGCAPAGTECSDYLEEDMLSDPPELNLSTCQRSGGTTGVTASLRHLAYWDEVVPNQAETYCTNLRSSSGALTVDERNIIGSTGPVDNAVSVDWDFCTLTQVFQVNRLKPSASEGYDPSGVGGACILESTPTGWKLRAPMRARADIRCRAQCFKLIFGE